MEDISSSSISSVRAVVENKAVERAVAAGAARDTVVIVESEAIPIAYTAGRCRFYVKAAGEWDGSTSLTSVLDELGGGSEGLDADIEVPRSGPSEAVTAEAAQFGTVQEITSYKPSVRNGEWTVSAIDLEWMAEGCYTLGCGGGGSPHHAFLQLKEMLRKGAVVKVVDISKFDDSAIIGWGGGMGSPGETTACGLANLLRPAAEVSAERLLGEEWVAGYLLV